MASPDTSAGYVEGDVIKVDGFDMGGQAVTNDLFMKVTATGTGGSITSVSATGTAPDASVNLQVWLTQQTQRLVLVQTLTLKE